MCYVAHQQSMFYVSLEHPSKKQKRRTLEQWNIKHVLLVIYITYVLGKTVSVFYLN